MGCMDCGAELHSSKLLCAACTMQRVIAEQLQPVVAQWLAEAPKRAKRRNNRRRMVERDAAIVRLMRGGPETIAAELADIERRKRIAAHARTLLGISA